jgi:DNA-binding YbaB/EbfC family protein
MFKELGQLAGLMKNLPKIKEEMERLQQRLDQVTGDGDAGAGMVKVRVNGKLDMLSCKVSPEALKDAEMLEDLIVAATNQALSKARKLAAEETQKMASSFGLPSGLNIPGLALPGS